MKKYLTAERLMLAVFIVGSFIGIWHALPMTNVVADEQYYVGGVLRAIEAHSILPLPGDVPYGTITFYLNYLFELPLLAGIFAWQGFHLSGLMTFLVLNPWINYLVPRFVSALVMSVFAWFFNRFLREEDVELSVRIAAFSALFCTIISATFLHTGKEWIVGMTLTTAGILYFYRALKKHIDDSKAAAYDGLWSIVLLFAAASNFLLMGFFMWNVPVLLWLFRNKPTERNTILKAIGIGVAILLFIFAINSSGFIADVGGFFQEYHPAPFSSVVVHSPQTPPLKSILLHALQFIETWPVIVTLLVFAFAARAVRNKLLFGIFAGYVVWFFIMLVFIATWYGNPSESLRYMFPFGFFFAGAIAALDYQKLKSVLWSFVAVQAFVYVYVLYLLAAPTTYNHAYDYVSTSLATEHALIYVDVPELSLPENAETSILRQDKFCGTKCTKLRTGSVVEPFAPVVLTYQSQLDKVDPQKYTRTLWVSGMSLAGTCAGTPIATFQSGASDQNYVSIEYNLGNYFLPDFWHLSRLGKNIYLYQITPQCMQQLPRKTS